MKKVDLIELLEEFDDDATISVLDDGTGELLDITSVDFGSDDDGNDDELSIVITTE